MELTVVDVKNVLTRTSGYLKTVTSHSLQPYRGCSFGRSLCGVGCYVRHNRWVTAGREWGGFLEVRRNAAESYSAGYLREREWARRSRGGFGIFLSSATEPFLPQEFRYRVTQKVLEAMIDRPPDELVIQTHSHRVTDYAGLLVKLGRKCALRVHLSIETDRDGMPGLPPHASSVAARFQAAAELRKRGLRTVITVSPLLPIDDPEGFFRRAAQSADAVVIDHYIQGDGTPDGRRTAATSLPTAMNEVDPRSTRLEYRDRIAEAARRHFPGRVGISIDGFAARYD